MRIRMKTIRKNRKHAKQLEEELINLLEDTDDNVKN